MDINTQITTMSEPNYQKDVFESKVHDENVRKYIIFGALSRRPFDSNKSFPKFCGNIINLAFMYAFSCYNDLNNRLDENGKSKIDEILDSSNANAIRVIQTMKKIYSEYAITNELMQFVLMDIYFDFEMEDDSVLRNCFPRLFNTSSDMQLGEVFAAYNKSIGNSKNPTDKNLDTWEEEFKSILELFPFLENTKLMFDSDRGWYKFELHGNTAYFPKHIVNTFGSVVVVDGDFRFLTMIDGDILRYEGTIGGSLAECKMTGFDGSDIPNNITSPYLIAVDSEYVNSYLNHECLEMSISPAYVNHKKDYAIDQLFNVNYKYIKNLALAIADALGRYEFEECGKRFRKEFEPKYKYAFGRFDEDLNNWDSPVLMLLVEVGPSAVLQSLFAKNLVISRMIIKNLQKRFGGKIRDELEKYAKGKLIEAAMKNIRIQSIGNSDTSENLKKSLVAEQMANIILSVIAGCSNNDSNTVFYIGNIQQNIDALRSLKKADNIDEKCKMVNVAFVDMLKRVICFYRGVFAYGRIKYEFEHNLSEKDKINKFQKKAEEAFKSAASKAYRDLSSKPDGDSVKYVLSEFRRLIDDCNKQNKSDSISDRVALYAVTGKYIVAEKEVFDRLLKDGVDVLADLTDDVDFWINKAIEILEFLRSGNFDEDDFVFDSVTPYIASYNRENVTRDGYTTVMFSLIIDSPTSKNPNDEVNVLTEFNYDLNSKYYCLPNISRSTNKWWIDPFIIKCQIFDEIFKTDEEAETR